MNKHIRLAKMIANLLDNRFNVAGFKFGIEPLLGIIPGFGDFIGLVLSLYIVWIGREMKIPADKLQRMIVNVIFDLLIGLFPVIGDLADFVFKANLKNLEILREFEMEGVIEGKIVN